MRTVFGTLSILLVVSLSLLAINTQPVESWTGGPVYIRADGSIDPPDAPISTTDNVTYVLTDNIGSDSNGIAIERDNIVVDGADHLVNCIHGVTLDISARTNVTIKNVEARSSRAEEIPSIHINSSSRISITNCKISGFIGINIWNLSNSEISGNSISGGWIGGDGYNIGLAHSSNNSISKNGLEWVGNYLYNCSNNTITMNHATYLILKGSSHNRIERNKIEGEAEGGGVYLRTSSNNNTVYRNLFIGGECGIGISESANNIIYENIIQSSMYGIESEGFNRFYHNTIRNNEIQVSSCSLSIWDNGYPAGGNYWSDYTGFDLYSGPFQNETGSDGIGDTPHLFPSNRDNYPLIEPYYDFSDVAVAYITPYKTVVPSGGSLPLNVTVENQGHSAVTFELKVDANYVYTPHERKVHLRASASSGWNHTTPGPKMTAIEGDTILLTLEPVDTVHHKFYVDYNNNAFPDEDEPQSPPFINTNITYNFTITTSGNFTYYCAYNPETMYGSLEAKPAPSESVQIVVENVTLAKMEKRDVEIVWNTTGHTRGKHVFNAYAIPLRDEIDRADNRLIDGYIIIAIIGDITGPDGYPDGKVDMRDVATAAKAFGSYPGFPKWNSNCDINNDKKLDMKDVATVAKHYGEIYE